MGTIAKRRLKSTMIAGKPLIELPPKSVELVQVDLAGAHRQKYVAWETAGRQIISQHIAADQLLQNYTSVLEIILRCADGTLVVAMEPCDINFPSIMSEWLPCRAKSTGALCAQTFMMSRCSAAYCKQDCAPVTPPQALLHHNLNHDCQPVSLCAASAKSVTPLSCAPPSRQPLPRTQEASSSRQQHWRRRCRRSSGRSSC